MRIEIFTPAYLKMLFSNVNNIQNKLLKNHDNDRAETVYQIKMNWEVTPLFSYLPSALPHPHPTLPTSL